MNDIKETVKYTHFIPPAKPIPDFRKNYQSVLVRSLDQLKEILSVKPKFIAFDTETTGLDPTKGKIVGFSFMMEGKVSYYIPVSHYGIDYNLGVEALELIYQAMLEAEKTFLFNVRFDFRYMEFAGFDMSKIGYSKYRDWETDRKSTRLNSSHITRSRMPSSA